MYYISNPAVEEMASMHIVFDAYLDERVRWETIPEMGPVTGKRWRRPAWLENYVREWYVYLWLRNCNYRWNFIIVYISSVDRAWHYVLIVRRGSGVLGIPVVLAGICNTFWKC